MTDITIIDTTDGSVKAELDSKDNTTVRDLLDMIGKGILVDARGTMKASKSVVLEKDTYKWMGTPKGKKCFKFGSLIRMYSSHPCLTINLSLFDYCGYYPLNGAPEADGEKCFCFSFVHC